MLMAAAAPIRSNATCQTGELCCRARYADHAKAPPTIKKDIDSLDSHCFIRFDLRFATPRFATPGIALACWHTMINRHHSAALRPLPKFLAALLLAAAIPPICKSDPQNSPAATQPSNSGNVPGGQTPNSQSGNPNQITNRDTNQPALRQKQEITNSSPDFPTAMNPAPVNASANSSLRPLSTSMPVNRSTTQRATTHTADPSTDAANTAVQKAQSAYDRQRQKVINTLQNNPLYQSALAAKNAARVPEATPTTNPSQNILSAADAKLRASQTVTEMQEKAIAADPAAQAAKARLAQAIQHRNKLANTAATRP